MYQEQRTVTINGKDIAWEGQGRNRQEGRPQSRHVPYQPPPLKRDIQRSIYNAVYESSLAVSRRQIADLIGVKKTTWLEDHIERMVRSRHLIRTEKPYRPGINQYFYEVRR